MNAAMIRIVLCVAICALDAAASSAAEYDAKRLDTLAARVSAYCEQLHVPGLAVTVVHDDKIVFEKAAGVRNPDTGAPVTLDSMFYIASCTKTYLAMGVVALAAEGRIDLDAPVKTYLPRFELADETLTNTLTVRDLLSHAKGVNHDVIVWLDAFTGQITEQRYYTWLKEATASGTHDYSNVHYTLLGRIVEAVTGQSWKDFLQDQIFDPAGMTRTTCYASRMYADADAAIPTILKDGSFVAATVRKTDRTMHAAGGMGTSAHDLARWLRLNINLGTIDGREILPRGAVREMHTLQASGSRNWPPFIGRDTQGHGLGWTVENYRGQPMHGHGGGYVGTSASISFLPGHKLGVAVVANCGGMVAEALAMDIYNQLLNLEGEDLLPHVKRYADRQIERDQQRQSTPAGPSVAAGAGLSLKPGAYIGSYTHTDWGTIEVFERNGTLAARVGDLPITLASTGTDTFLASYDTGEPDNGRFDIDKQQRVAGIVVQYADPPRTVRYDRDK